MKIDRKLSCNKYWSIELLNIIDRLNNTILALKNAEKYNKFYSDEIKYYSIKVQFKEISKKSFQNLNKKGN